MPMASLARRPTVLIVLHQEHSNSWPHRRGAQGHRRQARHAPAEPRRPAAGDARRSRRRHRVRRPDGRQRHARLGQTGDRLARNPAGRGEADARVVPRRANAGARARRAGVQLRGQAQRDRLLPDRADARGRSAVRGQIPALRLSMAFRRLRSARGGRAPRRGGRELSPTRPIATAAMRSASSSTRRSLIT